MTDTTLFLVDLQDSFAIITKHQKVKIDYGMYSMMISSVIFDDIIATFNDERFTDIIGEIAELRSTIQYINLNHPTPDMQDKCIELIKELSSLLYVPLRSLLNTGHLKSKQLSTITNLFVNEFTNHLLSDYFNFEDRSTYVPSVLHNIDFKAHIKSLMLRSTKNLSPSLQQEMNNLKLTATVTMIKGTPYTVYHITNTLEFLLVDLQKYLTGKKTAKKCLYCQRLFFLFTALLLIIALCLIKKQANPATISNVIHRKMTLKHFISTPNVSRQRNVTILLMLKNMDCSF